VAPNLTRYGARSIKIPGKPRTHPGGTPNARRGALSSRPSEGLTRSEPTPDKRAATTLMATPASAEPGRDSAEHLRRRCRPSGPLRDLFGEECFPWTAHSGALNRQQRGDDLRIDLTARLRSRHLTAQRPEVKDSPSGALRRLQGQRQRQTRTHNLRQAMDAAGPLPSRIFAVAAPARPASTGQSSRPLINLPRRDSRHHKKSSSTLKGAARRRNRNPHPLLQAKATRGRAALQGRPLRRPLHPLS